MWESLEISLTRPDGLAPGFYDAKLTTARFYYQRILPQTSGLFAAVMAGKGATMALDESAF